MYGGVSLAVYMNGIAQELLNLVRSTSGSTGKEPQDGTLPVYREVASYLSGKENGAFGHKFVVDIISGTSAGGINGVCLAKGLVRGLDNLKTLEKTWLEDGDIDTLLNDSRSDPDQYSSKEPKTSLFNSQRMYGKLLEAFRKMEKSADQMPPHIRSMDLFVTATDLRGLQLPMLLSDGQANERIHKHVFPFTFREYESLGDHPLNHFSGEYDRMLAFASRCTSSFPAAFEPVTLEDVMTWLGQQNPNESKDFEKHLDEWRALFFSAYCDEEGNVPLVKREFADGGYLDNRPFGHAIESIHAREADCPLSRKLVFIDPLPESRDVRRKTREISFVENTVLATASLPHYETIRGEIESIEKRNDWISTVNGIMERLQPKNILQLKSIIGEHFREFYTNPVNALPSDGLADAASRLFSESPTIAGGPGLTANRSDHPTDPARMFWSQVTQNSTPQSKTDALRASGPCARYDAKDLREMTKLLGGSYSAYHFTRLDTLTEQLALMIVRAMNAGLRREIDKSVSQIVTAWRNAHYVSNRDECCREGGAETENLFFRFYDIDFRIRRLNFFRLAIQQAIIEQSTERLHFGLTEGGSHDFGWNEELKRAITSFYKSTVGGLRDLYRLRALLLDGPARNPLAGDATELRDLVESLLVATNPSVGKGSCGTPLLPLTFDEIARLFDGKTTEGSARFRELVEHLMHAMNDVVRYGRPQGQQKEGFGTEAVSNRLYEAFGQLGDAYPELAGRMRYIYDYGYDLFDCSWLTLLSGGEFGEGAMVDVFRISPADSKTLWDESANERPKLAGISLGAFGGFLDRKWRRNDIMWGRLDAAERLITAVVPGDGEMDAIMRQESILKAQHAILLECTTEWIAELERTRHAVTDDNVQYQRLSHIREELVKGPVILQRQKGDPVNDPPWKTCFVNAYDFNREIESAPNLRRLGRSSAILSSMIDRIDTGKGSAARIAGYLKQVNRILLGMLDFSTPKSMTGVLGRYWLHLATLVSISLLVGGTLLGRISQMRDDAETVRSIGIALLVMACIVWLVRFGIETFIIKVASTHRQRQKLRAVAATVSFALFIALFLGTETLMVYGNDLWTTFREGFLTIARQQFGWMLL